MTLINLLLYAIICHDQILFEDMENGSSNCKGIVDVLEFGDTGQVGEYKRWILIVGHFKGSHAGGNMVRCVVPAFI
jgi:hypothetical protein